VSDKATALGNLAHCSQFECLSAISDLFPVFMKYILQKKITAET